MPILIRPATNDDQNLTNSAPQGVLHRLVAISDGEVVGQVTICRSAPEQLEVCDLFVRPESRQIGAGKALVDHGLEVVKAHGAGAVARVQADASDALQLFRRAGWSKAEEGANAYVFVSPAGDDHDDDWSIETTAVHAGISQDEFGPVTPPITVSSTYRVSHPGTYGRWAYARSSNPTRHALEVALTELEGGAGAGAFASGLAAIDAVLRFLEPGQRVVVSDDVYGGTWRLFTTVWDKLGIAVQPVDVTDLEVTRVAMQGASMLIVETPSNPFLRIADIPALAEIAHANGALFVVDNTFATPYLQRPLDLGADIVTHSTTKYLGGHSDVIGGALVAKSQEYADRINYLQRAAGAVAGPFDAFLVLRGIRTLAVRMDRHCENAMRIAQWLTEHDLVSSVHYPGLESHDGYELAQKQMRASGGMLSFRHKGGAVSARRVSQNAKLFTFAISLGAVESLIEVPATMTHVENTGSLLEVPNDLVRLSVGIENVDDLIADLQQALEDS